METDSLLIAGIYFVILATGEFPLSDEDSSLLLFF